MAFEVVVSLLHFGGTLLFYLSARLGVHPPYFICALLCLSGFISVLWTVSLLYSQRVTVVSPFPGPHFSVQRNQTRYFYRKTNKFGIQSDDSKICVVMVGLPARGKSLIAGKGMFCLAF